MSSSDCTHWPCFTHSQEPVMCSIERAEKHSKVKIIKRINLKKTKQRTCNKTLTSRRCKIRTMCISYWTDVTTHAAKGCEKTFTLFLLKKQFLCIFCLFVFITLIRFSHQMSPLLSSKKYISLCTQVRRTLNFQPRLSLLASM